MPQLYDSPEHQQLHLKAMRSLAVETGRDLSLVTQIYEQELTRLQTGANLTEYILLFACRRTREILRKSKKPISSQPVTA